MGRRISEFLSLTDFIRMTGRDYIRVTATGLKISEILDLTRIFLMSAQPITGDRMRNWVRWVSARYNGGFPGGAA